MTVPVAILLIVGVVLLVFALFILPVLLSRAPRTKRVLLYSGGVAVREWRVTGRIGWSMGFVTFDDPATDGKVVIGGAGVVIEDIA